MDSTNPLSFIFNGSDPNVNSQLRQRIALAMLTKQRRAPKTFGEGLSAIGDSLGEMGTMRRIEQQDLADQAADKRLEGGGVAGATAPAQRADVTAPAQPPVVAAYTPDREDAEPAAPTALARSAAPPMPAPGSLPPTGAPGNTGATTFQPPYQPPPAAAPVGHHPMLPVLDQKNFNSIDAAAPNAPPALARGIEPQTPSFDAPIGQYDPQSDPRRAIAMALLKQGQPGQPQAVGAEPATAAAPPQRPSVADFGQTPVLAPTGPRDGVARAMAPPPPDQVALNAPPPAPPPPQQIRQAPPQQQIAQAPGQPPAVPGYVPPGGGPEPARPTKTDYSPAEVQKMQEFTEAKRTGNVYTQERTARELAVLAEKRQYTDAANLDVYKEKIRQRDEANKAHELARGTQAGRQNEFERAQTELVEKRNEAEIVRRSNMKPDELYKRLDADKKVADGAIQSQSAQALARKAIKDGVVTGYGASMRIAKDKFADWAFKNGLKGDEAANTEIMAAGLKSGLREAIATVNGEGGAQVSNTDVKIAEGISGSDPNLQMKTIQTIMDRASEINFRKINRYEEYVDKTLGGLPVELKYRSTHGPTAPADKIEMLYQSQSDPQKAPVMRKYFDEIYGPGAAELELARVQRLNARRARGG
jgi:hypothetical protein